MSIPGTEQSASLATDELHAIILQCTSPEHLDAAQGRVIQAWGNGLITDGQGSTLLELIEKKRPQKSDGKFCAPFAGNGGRTGRVSRFASRVHPRSPDREASRDRRRMLGGSSALPHNLRHHYTEGHRAVLCIVAGEVKRQGVCEMPIDKIAALAGVCRTTVQNALHEARRLGHIKITERPRRGRKSLTNLIEVIIKTWREWLRRGPSIARLIGSKIVKTVNPTKTQERNREEAGERMRGWRDHAPPDFHRLRRA